MRSFLRSAGALLALAFLIPTAGRAAQADAGFESLARRTIDDFLRSQPEMATGLGDHRFDDQLSDYSAAAREAETTRLKAALAALAKIDVTALTGPNRIDAQLLRVQLQDRLFNLEVERAWEWNPLTYSASLGDAVFGLAVRDFAPASQRLRSIAQRLAAMPRVLEQAQANLRNPPRIHTETAILQTNGAIQMVRAGLESLLAQEPAFKAEIAPAQAQAIAALTRYRDWLQQTVLPQANGSFRLGAEKFREKLRLALDSDLSPEEILTRAERELVVTTDALYATARPLYEQAYPNAKPEELADRSRVIRAVLDRLSDRHANDATVVDRARAITADATAFVRAHQLVTIPDTPLEVIELPEFQRGVAVAYCDPPGALEPKGKTFFKVSPTPADWTAKRKESFFREYNDYMLHDLAVHEAMPGHYVQLAHANLFRAPTLVRAVWMSGTYVEGWAVYAERVMADAGFGGPEVKMQQLKMRLRATLNAIIDQKVQAGNMTEPEAITLMMQRGFQEEGEAVGKWRRACQSSTQLSTYFVGAVEHDDMRAAAEKELGASFNLLRYHDQVLSLGSVPVKYVRQELGW